MINTPHIKFALLAIIALLVCTTVLLSCKKEETLSKANATVLYTGPIEADGCGWTVRIDSANFKPGTIYYSPTNLDKSQLVNNLKVSINYKVLSTKTMCGMVPNGGQTQIEILHIEPVYTTQ